MKPKTWRITFEGVIEVEAETEDDAWDEFGMMSDQEVRENIGYTDIEEVEL